MMEGMPSDAENDLLSSDEEGEHSDENIMQGASHEEELCMVSLTGFNAGASWVSSWTCGRMMSVWQCDARCREFGCEVSDSAELSGLF